MRRSQCGVFPRRNADGERDILSKGVIDAEFAQKIRFHRDFAVTFGKSAFVNRNMAEFFQRFVHCADAVLPDCSVNIHDAEFIQPVAVCGCALKL